MTIDEVLTFWFGVTVSGDDAYQVRRKLWFRKNPATDQEIRRLFFSTYEQAIAGALAHWQTTPRGALALAVVLDQFPRNMFRGEAQSFASDAQARTVANRAIADGFDQQLPPLQRMFLYLPLEHSENLEDQFRCVDLFQRLLNECPELTNSYDYAVRHKDIIERFGRFPHRNHILGRETTAEEAEFLSLPGSSF
ncbi:MAG: DUF924 family protein [Cyanobacteria bacterium P01_E01_bin.6]